MKLQSALELVKTISNATDKDYLSDIYEMLGTVALA